MTVVELDAVAPFATRTLTPLEKERFEKMGPRRRKSFLAARLALKRLFRRCRAQQGPMVPEHVIETVSKNSPLPRCSALDGSDGPDLQCSVSHDRRLAIAVAHTGSVGVDIEEISPKALKAKKIYMNEKEIQLVRRSHLEDQEAALRIWSIKEGAAKAFGMNLAEAWQAVQVTDLGDFQSRFEFNTRNMEARHAVVANHIVTLVAETNGNGIS
jgi:phosphopantetheinyl transferase